MGNGTRSGTEDRSSRGPCCVPGGARATLGLPPWNRSRCAPRQARRPRRGARRSPLSEEGVRRVSGLPPRVRGTVVTMGDVRWSPTSGHQAILRDVRDRARARNGNRPRGAHSRSTHIPSASFVPKPLPRSSRCPTRKKGNPRSTRPGLRPRSSPSRWSCPAMLPRGSSRTSSYRAPPGGGRDRV